MAEMRKNDHRESICLNNSWLTTLFQHSLFVKHNLSNNYFLSAEINHDKHWIHYREQMGSSIPYRKNEIR